MKKRLISASCVLAQLVLVILVCGCASSSSNPETAKPVRPIDRVREGIVALKDQVSVTVVAATAVVEEPVSQVSSKRETFEKESRNTQTQIQSLRTDARELKQRAGEYLTIWGGEVTTFQPGSGGLATQTNSPRQLIKSKYDAMVDALLAARDAMVPLQSGLQHLETTYHRDLSPTQMTAVRAELQEVTRNSQIVNTHLQTALTRMDELQMLLAAANAPKQP